MLQKANQIEISHLTHETQEKFGCTYDQIVFMSELIYKCPTNIQCMVLNKLGLMQNWKYHLTTVDAGKLIDCILSKSDFELIEYGTPEWQQAKLQEQRQKLLGSPMLDINTPIIDFKPEDNE